MFENSIFKLIFVSLVKQVARNTIIQFAGKILGAVLALVTVSLSLRYLGKSGYGEYATIMGFLAMFSILADLGLYLTVTREISHKGADEKKIIGNAFTMKLVAALIVLALAPLAAMLFPYNKIIQTGILIGTFSFLFILLNQVLVGIFQKYLKVVYVAAGEVTGRVVWLIGTIAVIKMEWGILGLIWMAVLANLANFLIVFFSAKKFVAFKLSFDFKYWKYLLKISAPLAISVIFNLIYFKVDIVILSIFKPARDVGIYGAPYKVLESLITFAAIFAGILLPILSRYFKENLIRFKRIYQKSFDVIAIFVVPLIFGTLIFSREIITLFGGNEFEESTSVLRILIFAASAIYFSHLFGNAVIACQEQKKMMWIYFVTAVSSIALNFLLIPAFSYYGAAVSVLVSEVLVVTLLIVVVSRKTHILPSFSVLIKSVLSGIIMLGIIYCLPKWNFLISAAIGASVYFATLFLLKGFSKEIVLEITGFKNEKYDETKN